MSDQIAARAAAYRAGWDASVNGAEYDFDLSRAEDECLPDLNFGNLADFTTGWIDHAAGFDFGSTLRNIARYGAPEFDLSTTPERYSEDSAVAALLVAPIAPEAEQAGCSAHPILLDGIEANCIPCVRVSFGIVPAPVNIGTYVAPSNRSNF